MSKKHVPIANKHHVILRFTGGSSRNLQESAHFTVRSSATSFSDIRSYRSRGAPQLAGQPVKLFARKASSRAINIQGHRMGFLPHFQFLESLHFRLLTNRLL